MKTITVRQPWAGLLVLGIKINETRSWNTKHRGLLAIHSSAKMSWEGEVTLKGLMDSDPTKFFKGSEAYKTCTELGCILGTVEIVETFSTNNVTPPQSMELMLGNYERNRYFWQCANPVLFASPILAIGKLSIWNYQPLSEQK